MSIATSMIFGSGMASAAQNAAESDALSKQKQANDMLKNVDGVEEDAIFS